MAAAAGALAEVASHHEVGPAFVKVTLFIAAVRPRRWVVAAQICAAGHCSRCQKTSRVIAAAECDEKASIEG